MQSNGKPERTLESKIETHVLPFLYAVAVVLACLLLLALVVMAWKEAL
jgi:hypothetical protein